MIYSDVDLHNIAEMVKVRGHKGLRLQRVPESVRVHLEEPARNKTINPGGAEIRFVRTGGPVRITLSSSGDDGTVRLFRGPFDSKETWTIIANIANSVTVIVSLLRIISRAIIANRSQLIDLSLAQHTPVKT